MTATPFPAAFLRSPAAKVGAIVLLLLAMQVPLMMVSGLISEREARQAEVLAGFRRGWGPDQALAGPMLAVPYTWPDRTPVAAGAPPLPPLRGWARIPAARLDIQATLDPETRRRGLFNAIVYTARIDMTGTLAVPPLDLRHAPGNTVDWAGALVLLGASDLRGLPPGARLEWNGATLPLDPADAGQGCGLAMLAAPAGLQAAPAPGTAIPFRTALTLRGTQAIRAIPLARQTTMRIASPWPTPSFTGASLPLRFDAGPAGFDAQWDIAGDAASATWQQRDSAAPNCRSHADAPLFDAEQQAGVELQEAVPTYLMVQRASKYGVLFLALSFLTLFLFENLAAIRVHLVQYGLMGLSVSLFALLLVSIAEPLGFTAGYALATLAVLAQASLYALAVVGRRLALVFAGVLAALFAFLYVVLRLDSYALLSGAVALFVILSVVMAATRRVQWHAPS